MRITARLINAETGGVDLWADHFDGSLEDVFDLQDKVASSDLQDKVASSVAGVIEPELQAAESVRSAVRRTADKTAYDLYLLAHARAMSWAQQIREAIDLFEQAIERDPCYGPALASTAYGYYRLLLDELSENRDADRIKSANLARRALEMGGDDPEVLANAALVLAYFREDIGAMLALVDQALSLSPSFARGWHISGILRVWAGEPDIAIEHLETALRLSPRSVGTTRFVIGAANFFARRFGNAFRAIVGTDMPGHAAQDEQVREHIDDVDRLQSTRHPDGQALMGELVDDVEQAELASIVSTVLDKIIGPDVVWPLRSEPDA
jgi:adenylate cyclase